MTEPRPQPLSSREPDAVCEEVLVGLVARMDDGQRLRLKVVLVEQAVEAVARCLRVGNDDSGGVIVAREWLAELTADRAARAAIYVIFDRMDGGARSSDYPGFFLAPADAAGSDDVVYTARVARRAVAAAAVYARSNTEWFARGESADDFAEVFKHLQQALNRLINANV